MERKLIASQIRKAKKYESTGALLDANTIYTDILSQFPKNLEAKKGLQRIERRLSTSSPSTSQNGKAYDKIAPDLRNRLWKMHLSKNYRELLAYIEKYLGNNREDYELLFLAGSCCRHLKKFHQAMDYMKKALAHEPENFGANLEVAKIFADSGLTDLARQTFNHCIQAFNLESDIHVEYGKWLMQNNEHEEAKTIFFNALDMFPKKFELMSHLGEAFFNLGQYQEAHEYFTNSMPKERKTSSIHRQLLHANKMNAAAELGLVESLNESVAEVEQLISENETNSVITATPKFNLALHYLRTGDTRKGWKYYLDRFEHPGFPSPARKFEQPRIASIDELNGKTVLVWREQGVGDEIVFYNLLLNLLQKSNCKIIVECDERLVTLLERAFPTLKIRPEEFDRVTLRSSHDDFDAHFPLNDLPYLLGVTPNISGNLVPWIKVDQTIAKYWSDHLPSEKLRIGFSWESGLKSNRRNHHFTSIEFFDKLIKQSDYNWICLQYTATADDIELFCDEARSKILLPDVDLKNDFENVSGIIKNCDIVLSPRTAVAAMAAAIGCPSATFDTGSSSIYDLGANMHGVSIFNPPLLPYSTNLNLRHGLTTDDKDQLIAEFFNKQLLKVNSVYSHDAAFHQ